MRHILIASLVLATLAPALRAESSKMRPPCASTIFCSVDEAGRASCELREFQSSHCFQQLAETHFSWSKVTAGIDESGRPMLLRTLLHSELREQRLIRTHSAEGAKSIAATPFDFILDRGDEIEVEATLYDAAGKVLFSSRLFLLSDEDGFHTALNHPAMEHAGTTHHVVFEKSEP